MKEHLLERGVKVGMLDVETMAAVVYGRGHSGEVRHGHWERTRGLT